MVVEEQKKTGWVIQPAVVGDEGCRERAEPGDRCFISRIEHEGRRRGKGYEQLQGA